MAERVRVGVIGTSWYADMMHLPNLKSHPRAELTAICGRNRERAEEMARKYEIPGVFTDYREMIEKGDLQAVVVATPDDLHHPMTMDALDAGLHVLCEKPMALSAVQARQMLEKAEAAGVKHMVYFTYRWWPFYRYLKQLVEEGYIGRCYHVQLRYLSRYGRAYSWRFDRRRGTGVLGDLGAHMIDMARWLVGDVARVSGHLSTFIDRPEEDERLPDPANDAATLLLTFESGAQGMIQLSGVAHVGDRGQEQHVTLHGEAGTLEIVATALGAEIRGARKDEEQILVLREPDELWGGVDARRFPEMLEVFLKQPIGDRLFIDAIVEDRTVAPSFYDGLKAQEVIDAAIKSHEEGVWVSL